MGAAQTAGIGARQTQPPSQARASPSRGAQLER